MKSKMMLIYFLNHYWMNEISQDDKKNMFNFLMMMRSIKLII